MSISRSALKSAANPFFSLAVVLLVSMGAIYMVTSKTPPVQAQTQAVLLRTLTVTGQGKEQIQTTLTQVQLGVEAQGKTAQEVQQAVAKRSTAVVNLLKSRSVEKLQTTGINLNPNYSYDNGRQTLIGYQASNTVSFRLPTEKIGSLLDDAVQAGASKIDSVSFTASDSAIATAQKAALQKATQEAQAQANAVFSSLGLTAKGIASIQINGAQPPQPMPVAPFSASTKLQGEAAMDSTPVIGGEQTVDASVTLQIQY